MAKKKKSKSTKTSYSVDITDRILPEEGLHDARVLSFVELGTQDTDWGKKFMVEIAYEIVDESAVFNEDDGEQNFVLYRRYSRSLSKRSALGKAVRVLHPEDIDDLEEVEMDDILNAPCRIQVEYSEDEQYANIVGVFKVKGKAEIEELQNEPFSLYLDENFDQDVFDILPDWKQEMIAESKEGEELIDEGTMEFEPPKKPKSKKGKGKKTKGADEEDDEDFKPKSKRRTKRKDDEEEEEEEEEQEETEEEEDEGPKKRKRRTGREPDDEDENEEEEEDEKHSSRRKQTARGKSKQTTRRKTGRGK